MTLSAGMHFGPYEIEASLGAGGMGEVYRAKDTRLGRTVAIKVLSESLAEDKAALARFEREAKAVAALSHPNILSIFDFGTIDGTTYAVMELLEGESLRQRLTSGPLPVRKSIEVASKIAEGLAAAHAKGIIHRDLKPDNVFLTDDGRVKILDFGLAKLATASEDRTLAMSRELEDITKTGTVLGTVGYMSPEQVKGEEADSRSDIFSFGSVLYEMVSGERPFRRDTVVETMSAILREDPKDIEALERAVPPALSRIIRHCLEKNAAERFQSARDLAFDLESLSGASSTAQIEPLTGGRTHRKGWRLAAVVGVVALATGGLGWWVHGLARPAVSSLSDVTVRQLTFGHRWMTTARFVPQHDAIVFSEQSTDGSSRVEVLRKGAPDPEPLPFDHLHLLAVSKNGELAVLTHATYLWHRLFIGTLARMPLAGGSPKEILQGVREADWAPDGSGLAILRTVDQTDRLEYPIGKVLATTPGYFSDLRFSPDGKSIAFFEHPLKWDDRGVVKLVDLDTGKVKTLSHEFFLLEGLAWSPNGKEVLFSALNEGEGVGARTWAVTPEGKMRVVLVGFGLDQLMDVAPDGRMLVLREETVKSIYVHQEGEKGERLLRTGSSYYQLAMTADGSHVCYTDERMDAGRYYSVIVRATDGSPAVRVGPGWCPDISRDGRWVLGIVGKAPAELWAYPTGPGQPVRLDDKRFSQISYAFFYYDGQHVAACGTLRSSKPGCLELAISGGSPQPLPTPQSLILMPSPDGHRLASSNGGGPGAQEIYGRDGKATPIPGLKAGSEYVVGWSPDGKALRVMGRLPPNGFYVDRLSLADGNRKRLLAFTWPQQPRTLFDQSVAMGSDPVNYVYAVRDTQTQLYEASGVE